MEDQIRHTHHEWTVIFGQVNDHVGGSAQIDLLTLQEYRDNQKEREERKLGQFAKVELDKKSDEVCMVTAKQATFSPFLLKR